MLNLKLGTFTMLLRHRCKNATFDLEKLATSYSQALISAAPYGTKIYIRIIFILSKIFFNHLLFVSY